MPGEPFPAHEPHAADTPEPQESGRRVARGGDSADDQDWPPADVAGEDWLADGDDEEDLPYPDDVGLAEAAVPETLDAGFLPRNVPPAPGRGGSGFASGDALDTCLPGPVLAGFADNAAGADRRYRSLDDDELVGNLIAFNKLEAWAAAAVGGG